MSYTAYEVTTGDAESYVEDLQASYTEGGEFNSETTPTLATVERHLTNIHADMAGMMVAAGYAVTQTDDDVERLLMGYNARGAAYMVELGQVTSGFAAEGGTSRLAELAKWKTAFQGVLDTDALELLGAAVLSSATAGDARLVTAGGLSLSDMEGRGDNADFNPMKMDVDFSNTGGAVGEPE